MKTCPRCMKEKPHKDYSINRARKDGLQSWCKDCFNKRQRERWAEQRDKSRRRYLSRTYDLANSDYERLLADQNYRCAVCHKRSAKSFCVDHCHKTGIVRGLLCFRCNAGIGLLGDDVERIEVALGYLRSAPIYAERVAAA